MKFHEDILNGYKGIERTRFCHRNCYLQRGITEKIYIQELWFLHSACHPMLVNIYVKFHEDILNTHSFFMLQRGHDFLTDRQTDRWTDDSGKNSMSPNPEAGRSVMSQYIL